MKKDANLASGFEFHVHGKQGLSGSFRLVLALVFESFGKIHWACAYVTVEKALLEPYEWNNQRKPPMIHVSLLLCRTAWWHQATYEVH